MSQFSVNAQQLQGNTSSFRDVRNTILRVNSSIVSITSSLAISGASRDAIQRKLSLIHDKLLDEAVSMDSLTAALERMAELYEKTEARIIANVEGSDGTVESRNSDGGKSLWERLIDALIPEPIRKWLEELIEKMGEEDVDITKAQEKEHDRYMKNEVAKIQDMPRFSESTWNNASIEERKTILNDYIRMVSEVMGLDYDSITFESLSSRVGTINGGYNHSRDIVKINSERLDDSDSYDLFTTVTHELRHAYQWAAIENPDQFQVSPETLKEWQESFAKYKSASGFKETGMSNSEAMKAYRDQSVERDARDFAGQD